MKDDLQQSQGHDELTIALVEQPRGTLTDALARVCCYTLEKNREFIDKNSDIRSVTITMKLSENGQTPYKVFFTPTHEEKI